MEDTVEEDEGRDEKVAATVWQAMGEVASISQITVSRSGVMLRFEAIRTESNKISYHPLEPYQDRSQIGRQGRAWQQIMMFFVRTQRQHQWKSPSYRLNQRQKRAFERLMTLARQSVDECVDEDRLSESSESSDEEDDRNADTEERVVHVAGVCAGGWGDDCGGTVEGVAGGHDCAVRRIEHPMCGVGARQRRGWGIDRVGDAGEGSVAGVRDVRQSNPSDPAIGPDCDRRVSCDIERPLGFPTTFAAIGQVGVRGDADGVVDGDVAAQ